MTIAVLFGGSACSSLTDVGLEDLDDGVDDSSAGAIVGIDSLDPNWGPTEGGTLVSVLGWGFDGEVALYLGSASLDVTRVSSEELLIATPYLGFEASVDVTVTSELGEASLNGGFTYSDSGPPPETETEDTTEDTGAPPTGLTGGLVEFSLLQIACPDCFGLTADLTVSATAAFHDPVSDSWTSWFPASGTCLQNPVSEPASSSFNDVGEFVYLSSGSRSFGLRRTTGDSGPSYTVDGLDESDFIRTAYFDLTAPDGGFSVQDAVLTPQGWTNIQPEAMLYSTVQSAFSATIQRNNASFTWSPSGGDGTFMILLDVYNAGGTAYLGQVLCRGPDNGAMTIPSAYLSSFPSNSLLGIYLFRYQLDTATLPLDGSALEGVARMGVLGTGVLN